MSFGLRSVLLCRIHRSVSSISLLGYFLEHPLTNNHNSIIYITNNPYVNQDASPAQHARPAARLFKESRGVFSGKIVNYSFFYVDTNNCCNIEITF
jgi:hypothetical protein